MCLTIWTFFINWGFSLNPYSVVKLDLFHHRAPFLKDLVSLDFHIAEDAHVTALCADSVCGA